MLNTICDIVLGVCLVVLISCLIALLMVSVLPIITDVFEEMRWRKRK